MDENTRATIAATLAAAVIAELDHEGMSLEVRINEAVGVYEMVWNALPAPGSPIQRM